MHRQAINNSTFLNDKILVMQYLIGHASITKNMQVEQTTLVYKRKYQCVYTTVNRAKSYLNLLISYIEMRYDIKIKLKGYFTKRKNI